MAQLTDPQRQAIEAAIFAGNKIEAIKLYREATGVGLAEAKQAVEAMEASLRQKHPEKFTASRKKGCVGVVAVFGLVLGVMLLLVKMVRVI
jgi:ribosomal protein L7/L12